MCIEVQNLFNVKDVILSRQDIFKIAKYAIENNIIDVTLDVPLEGEDYIGVYETKHLCDIDYNLEYVEPSEDDVTEQEEKQDAVSS